MIKESSMKSSMTRIKRVALSLTLMIPAAAWADEPELQPMIGDELVGQESAVALASAETLLSSETSPISHSETELRAIRSEVQGPSRGGLFGDLGFYVLSPKWGGGNPAFLKQTLTFEESDPPGGDPVLTGFTTQQFDFDHGTDFAPLVQLGYLGQGGLGIRGRWWTLSSTDTISNSFVSTPEEVELAQFPDMLGVGGFLNLSFLGGGPDDESLSFSHNLSMDVVDLEGIWNTALGRTSLLFSAGVRYGHIEQAYGLAVDGERLNLFRQDFDGVGPTTSLQASRRIGQTNLSLYGLGRGSLLFGDAEQQRRFPLGEGGPGGVLGRTLDSESIRPVGELEFGANWCHNFRRHEFFIESGFVGMLWLDAGNAANSDAIGGINPLFLSGGNLDQLAFLSLLSGGSNNANQDLGLVGMRFSAGIRF
jgi:hypothetical protein